MKAPNTDSLSILHPGVSFLYFAAVIGFSAVSQNPILTGLSLTGAIVSCIRIAGRSIFFRMLRLLLPMMSFAALVNPLFSHKGATILAYFPSGNPLTLESILFGLEASLTLGATVLWFASVTQVMTSDKLIYLFGRITPALGLLLSMTLRFVPRFMSRLTLVREAQTCLDDDSQADFRKPSRARGFLGRIGHAASILSIMITWALESSLDTADSMKARGHGLPGRTAFSLFVFTRRDRVIFALVFALAAVLLISALIGAFEFAWFPTVFTEPSALTALGLAAYAALCFLPHFIGKTEVSA